MDTVSYNYLVETIKDAEKVAKAFDIEPFPIYLLGGSACILGEYNDRATIDIDFIDLNYAAYIGKVFSIFRDYDMLDYECTTISSKFKERAVRLCEFEYLKVYVLSKEDIIVSKIIRLGQKDIEDINELIKDSDKSLILRIIDEVLARDDLFDSKKQEFAKNLKIFKERYNV